MITRHRIIGTGFAISIAMGLAGAASASAAPIARYDFSSGSSVTSSPPNLTVSGFSLGAGIVERKEGGVSQKSVNMYVRTTATMNTLAAAIVENDYLSFVLDIDSATEVSLASLVLKAGYSNNLSYVDKVLTASLLTSIDGFSSSDLVSSITTKDTAIKNATPHYQSWRIDLSAPKFQNLSGRVEFRIYVYDDADSKNIIHRFDDVVLEGVVTGASKTGATVDIPEPDTYALLCGLLAMGHVLVRRRGPRADQFYGK